MALVAALFAAGPTPGAEPASAAAGPGQVEFTGGSVLGALVCKSQPSTDRLALAAGSRVLFVNRLGEPATLRVDGRDVAAVSPNQGVPVVFRYGPVSVSMVFPCSLGVAQQFRSVVVAVSRPTGPATTEPAPTRATGDTDPGEPAASSPPAVVASARSTPGGTDNAEPPASDPPLFEPEPVPPIGSELQSPTFTAAGDPAVVVERPVPASGTPRERASNLLALIAAICLVGVAIAAIRSIVSQRTTRPKAA